MLVDKIKTYPANLILRDKKCLIIGGGKVAARKLDGLLKTSVNVTVVAPEVSESIRTLAQNQAITLLNRPFSSKDILHHDIVFIATNDKILNGKIVRICKKRKILCCSVDESWRAGDFICPASFEKDGFTIAVSSNGVSCRKSRLIKENIARHISMSKDAELTVIGTDHNCLPLEIRRKYHFTRDKYALAGSIFSRLWGIHEFFILNTCNRIELIAVSFPDSGLERILLNILGFDELDNNSFYIKKDFEAYRHLCLVMSGLYSQSICEKNIISQVRNSFNDAHNRKWAGTICRQWFDGARHLSKIVRGKTGQLADRSEIDDFFMKMFLKKYSSAKPLNIIVMGSGSVGKNIVDKLSRNGYKILWFYHHERPVLKDKKNNSVTVLKLSALDKHLSCADVVIGAACTSVPLVNDTNFHLLDAGKNLLLVDLAVPANIEVEKNHSHTKFEKWDLDTIKKSMNETCIDKTKIFAVADEVIRKNKNLYEKLIYDFKNGNKTKRSG